jgi:hypothetical protein
VAFGLTDLVHQARVTKQTPGALVDQLEPKRVYQMRDAPVSLRELTDPDR